jgi:hypothetical protein
VRADERQPDGSDGDGRCAEARVRGARHRGHPYFGWQGDQAHALGACLSRLGAFADMLARSASMRDGDDLHADQIWGLS